MHRESLLPLVVIVLLAFCVEGSAELVGHWPLDEGTGGQVTDATGGGHDGTINGATWVSPGWNGEGTCLQFDGVDDVVEVPHANDLRFDANSAYTIVAWVNMTVRPGHWSGIVTKGRETGNWYGIWVDPSNQWIFGHQPNNQAGSQVEPGVWVHVAMVYSNANKKIYLNGKLDNETTASASGDNTGDLWFGAAKGVTEFAPASIDDIRIYNHALSAAEIKALIPPKLKAYNPNPADGEIGVTMPLLQWTAGDTAVFHDVYLGTSPDLTEADCVAQRSVLAMYYHAPGLTPGGTCYWRVDEIEVDMTTGHTGNVWSFVVQALTAYYPLPADGAVNASTSPMLSWMPGQAAMEHHLYFGSSVDAVTQGTAEADKGVLTETTFAAGALENMTTYYWRVDETVPGGTVRTGPVWSFTTVLPVEDFESYTDEEGSRIYETWTDGWTNNTGSTVGYVEAPFAEQTIVHGGGQSMPFDYNNVNPPFYSEAERQFSSTQDWTIDGVDALALFLRGVATDGAGKLYVAIEDSTGKVAAVASDASLTSTTWTAVSFPLSEFTGVNLSRVKVLYLGVGDRNAPTPGGAGLVYIDDIRVTKP